MVHHRRFAALCLLWLSANGVLGKIRGSYDSDSQLPLVLEDFTDSNERTSVQRVLKHQRGKRNNKRQKGKHADEYPVEEETGAPEETGVPVESHAPPMEYPSDAQPSYEVVYEEEEEVGGAKGGKQKGSINTTGGKYKSKDKKSSRVKETEGGKKSASGKRGVSSSDKQKGTKDGLKGTNGGFKVSGSKKTSDKTKGSKSKKGVKYGAHIPGDGPVLKKSKDSNKSYDKSKYKLKKSSSSYDDTDDYTTAESTHPPGEIPGEVPVEPTRVSVPMSFYFSFGEHEARRRLDAHDTYEPTPEEVATFEGAAKEYATGLFEYLHSDNPATFVSVTPIVEKVVIKKGSAYPLQIDVVFHILYYEAPENAPDAAEVASILETAFASEEFAYFYLWGRDDIWNSVTSVKAAPNFPEGAYPEDSVPGGPVSPDVPVYGTMVFDFNTDPAQQPTEADYATLDSLIQSFYTDVMSDLFKDNPDTGFEVFIVTRESATFNTSATPPVVVDYSFEVKFDSNSLIVPSSEDVFSVMAAGDQTNMFESFIRVYLAPSQSIWSAVNRVSFVELMPLAGEVPLPPAQSAVRVVASMIYSFFQGTATRPEKEAYDKLQMATNFFFLETLTNAFQNTEINFRMSTTTLESSFYTEGVPEPLQVDYDTQAFFEGDVIPDPETVFEVLELADYESYIKDVLWPEGSPWNNVNGVMYTQRIQPPPAQ